MFKDKFNIIMDVLKKFGDPVKPPDLLHFLEISTHFVAIGSGMHVNTFKCVGFPLFDLENETMFDELRDQCIRNMCFESLRVEPFWKIFNPSESTGFHSHEDDRKELKKLWKMHRRMLAWNSDLRKKTLCYKAHVMRLIRAVAQKAPIWYAQALHANPPQTADSYPFDPKDLHKNVHHAYHWFIQQNRLGTVHQDILPAYPNYLPGYEGMREWHNPNLNPSDVFQECSKI